MLANWFYWHLDPELRARYGDDVQVILTIDNAGCHPPDLNSVLDYVVLIQPMDQGVLLPVNKNSFCENHKDSDFNGVLEMNSYVSCIQRKP